MLSHELEKIRSIISNEPNFFYADKKKEKKSSYDKNEAAKIIQDYWRSYKISKFFLKVNGYETYVSMLKPSADQKEDSGANALAKLMLGRTTAIDKCDIHFPIINPYPYYKAGYHRSDINRDEFLDLIIEDFEQSPNHSKYFYLPICMNDSMPIENVLSNYKKINPDLNTCVILKMDKCNIGFLKITRDLQKKYYDLLNLLVAAGVTASIWQIYIYYIQNKKLIEAEGSISPKLDLLKNLKLPNSATEFYSGKILEKLSNLSNANNSTKYLAAAGYNMLTNLTLANDSIDSLQRIYVFLNIALKFHKNNYERFALMLYIIIQEISILLHKKMTQYSTPAVNYSDFKDETIKNAIAYFGIQDTKEETNYKLIAIPANSGANAYVIARNLAEQITITDPKIEIFEPYYFEFGELERKESKNEASDIYILSAGPMVFNNKVSPGSDINKIIERHFSFSLDEKPCTLVIDLSTALYKNLKLAEKNLKLVRDGKVSIIAHESHQKFGLLHSDQVQFGRAFAICSKKFFKTETLKSLENNAKQDLYRFLDMTVSAFISTRCGGLLEKIKQQHFINGDIYRKILEASPNAADYIAISTETSLNNSKELYFSLLPSSGNLSRFSASIPHRDSFAHFHTTYSEINKNFNRLSPSATDKTDILVEGIRDYLMQFILPDLQRIFEHFILFYEKNTQFSIKDEITFFAIASALNSRFFPLEKKFHEMINLMSILGKIIQARTNSMVGRKCFASLMQNYQINLNLSRRNGLTIKTAINYFRIVEKILKNYTDDAKSDENLNKLITELNVGIIDLLEAEEYIVLKKIFDDINKVNINKSVKKAILNLISSAKLSQKCAEHAMYNQLEKLKELRALFAEKFKDIINNTQQDSFQNSALHYATYNGYIGIVKFLIEQGADKNIKNCKNHRPKETSSFGACKIVLENYHSELTESNCSTLEFFTKEFDLDWTIKDDRYNLNLQEALGLKCHLHAVSNDLTNLKKIKNLYAEKFKAIIQTQNRNNKNSLDLALTYHRYDVVEFLIEEGAEKVTPISDAEKEPLRQHWFKLLSNGNLEKLIQFKKAFPEKIFQDILNFKDDSENSALHLSISRGFDKIARWLIANGIDIAHKNINLGEKNSPVKFRELAINNLKDKLADFKSETKKINSTIESFLELDCFIKSVAHTNLTTCKLLAIQTACGQAYVNYSENSNPNDVFYKLVNSIQDTIAVYHFPSQKIRLFHQSSKDQTKALLLPFELLVENAKKSALYIEKNDYPSPKIYENFF